MCRISQAETALEHASEQDKPYFRKYIELANCWKDVLDNESKLKSLRTRRDDLIEKRKNIVVDVDYDTDEEQKYIPIAHDTVTRSIIELETKMEPLEKALIEAGLQKDMVCADIISFDNNWNSQKASENK